MCNICKDKTVSKNIDVTLFCSARWYVGGGAVGRPVSFGAESGKDGPQSTTG